VDNRPAGAFNFHPIVTPIMSPRSPIIFGIIIIPGRPGEALMA